MKLLSDFLVVKEFPDVFPKDFLGVPPKKQVEFQMELVHVAVLISKMPYRLAPLEM